MALLLAGPAVGSSRAAEAAEAVAAGTGQAGAARAAETVESLRRRIDEQEERLKAQQERLEEQLRQLRRQADDIGHQRRQLDDLARSSSTALRLPPSTSVPLPRPQPSRAPAGPIRRADAAPPVRVIPVQAEERPPRRPDTRSPPGPEAVGQRPGETGVKASPAVAALPERSRVLLPQGRLVLEPSVEYIRSDVNKAEVVGFTVLPGIVFGDIYVAEANRDTVVSTASARVGVTSRLEVEGRVPYVYRSDSTATRPLGVPAVTGTTTDATGHGFGDVEFAARYQINDGQDDWPYFIGSMRVRSPTGTDPFEVEHDPLTLAETELPTGSGFWSVQGGVTVLYPSDPAVLYGGLTYTWTMERDVGGQYGTVDPGDVVGVNFGLGLALNERLSFSLGYDHSVVLESTRDNEALPGSDILQVGTLTFGSSFRLGERTSLNLSIAAGLTDDAPDLRVVFKVPVSLGL